LARQVCDDFSAADSRYETTGSETIHLISAVTTTTCAFFRLLSLQNGAPPLAAVVWRRYGF